MFFLQFDYTDNFQLILKMIRITFLLQILADFQTKIIILQIESSYTRRFNAKDQTKLLQNPQFYKYFKAISISIKNKIMVR